MFDYGYRLSLIKLLIRVLVAPSAGSTFLLGAGSTLQLFNLPTWAKIAIPILSVPTYWISRNWLDNHRAKGQAKRFDASLVPVYRGKLPGNVDLIPRLAAGFHGGYPTAWIDELLDEAGCDTLNLRLLWQDKIISRDHLVIKFLLSTGFEFFDENQATRDRLYSFFGEGIFAGNRARAKEHRAVARPYFARERISDYRALERYTNKVIALLHRCAESKEACDVQDLFSRFTLDTAGEFLFNTREINSLDAPLAKPRNSKTENLSKEDHGRGNAYEEFATALEEAQYNMVRRATSGIKWYFQEFFSDSQPKPMNIIHRWIEPMVQSALEQEEIRKEKGGPLPIDDPENATFINHLAASAATPTVVRDQLFNMLLAARDTTSALLTFTTYLLSLHPENMDKLKAEVLQQCGNEAPTYDDLKSMRYLRAVFNETLRLFPPVNATIRTTSEACIIPASAERFYIPSEGAAITCISPSIHRNKALWGEDAENFDPERWLDERVKIFTSDPFMFVPFSAGPRICLGQQFAYNQAGFMLVRILQSFDKFTLVQEEAAPLGSIPATGWNRGGRKYVEKITPQHSLVVNCKGGVWVRMECTQ